MSDRRGMVDECEVAERTTDNIGTCTSRSFPFFACPIARGGSRAGQMSTKGSDKWANEAGKRPGAESNTRCQEYVGVHWSKRNVSPVLVKRSDRQSGPEHKLEEDSERRQHGNRARYGNTVRAVASQLRSIPRAARRGNRADRTGRALRKDRRRQATRQPGHSKS